jgi:hypothetical protein
MLTHIDLSNPIRAFAALAEAIRLSGSVGSYQAALFLQSRGISLELALRLLSDPDMQAALLYSCASSDETVSDI